MSQYYVAYDSADLKCYPNYSFEVGDVDGGGRMEFICLDQSGNLLRAVSLDGDVLFERELHNNGNWGTPLVCAADINGDGRCEVIVPDGNSVVAFDGSGQKVRERLFERCAKDDFGICVPLLGIAKILSPDEPSIIAAIAGGEVAALDSSFNVIWRTGGLRRDFGHEIHFADIDGDGLDEIAFCTVDHIGGGLSDHDHGDLVLLDHDGTVLLRKRVDNYIEDTHFDDIAMADFMGTGGAQILLEKGLLINLGGRVIWDISEQFDHGQWIAHTSNPGGRGKLVFISELWGVGMRSLLFTGHGEKIADIGGFPWPALDPGERKIALLPSRCHMISWTPGSPPEIFLSQQAHVPGPHNCVKTVRFGLKALFMDINGNFSGELNFNDAQIEGYYYNGEVHSKVADVDGDGRPEIVFPRQDGHVMVIKKR